MDGGLIENLLLVFHLIIAILLIGVVLMQRSEGGALGMGGGGGGGGAGGGMFSARGAASTLTRMTAGLAAIFMITSITLAILAGQDKSGESIFQSEPTAEESIPFTQEQDGSASDIPTAE